MAGILVGTASWTDRTLVRSGWYPKGTTSAEDRLRYYADHFPLVEVDSTYYLLPTTEVIHAWINRTPDDFTFNVKAFSLLTQHPTDPKALPEGAAPAGKRRVYLSHLDPADIDVVWERFTTVLRPLARAGRLGALLFQFPPWFTIKRANRDYVVECAERASPLPVCVELRNHTWFEKDNIDETIGLFEQHRIPLVSVDTVPGDKGSVPPLAVATRRELAVVRFHGRGRAKPGLTRQAAAADYSYPMRALAPWVDRIEQLAEESDTVHVVFRNAVGDHAVRNARRMTELLADAGLPVVSPRPADDDEEEDREQGGDHHARRQHGGESVVQQRLPGT
ncbi:MAG: DUF72 domain-containing protein [Acidimicrobiales bacterium]